MSDIAYIASPKLCDVCKFESKTEVEAEYDARMLNGQWANLCGTHFDSRTGGKLGTGMGQRLIIGEKPSQELRIKAALEKGDIDALEEAIGDGDPADYLG